MNSPSQEQIDKLPKWATEHIKDLTRRTLTAEKKFTEYTDSQTPSDIYHGDHICIGDSSPQSHRRYVQSDKISIEYHNVLLNIYLRPEEKFIDLQWSMSDHLTGDVAMIPVSFNKVKLISKKNMRD